MAANPFFRMIIFGNVKQLPMDPKTPFLPQRLGQRTNYTHTHTYAVRGKIKRTSVTHRDRTVKRMKLVIADNTYYKNSFYESLVSAFL